VLSQVLDAGIDKFFNTANDLVVPTEGSWLVDDSSTIVAAERIGCFGPGGNLGLKREIIRVAYFSRRHALVRSRAGVLSVQPIIRPAASPPKRPAMTLTSE